MEKKSTPWACQGVGARIVFFTDSVIPSTRSRGLRSYKNNRQPMKLSSSTASASMDRQIAPNLGAVMALERKFGGKRLHEIFSNRWCAAGSFEGFEVEWVVQAHIQSRLLSGPSRNAKAHSFLPTQKDFNWSAVLCK